MSKMKILLCLAGILIGVSFAGIAFPGTDTTQPPAPGMFHRMGASGLSGDSQYLYVVAAGKILEYDMAGMSLVKSVDLPEMTPPAPPSDTSGKSDFRRFPPPMGAPHGVWATDHFLYVMAGPKLYKYSTPDLTLQLTEELPRPELPASTK